MNICESIFEVFRVVTIKTNTPARSRHYCSSSDLCFSFPVELSKFKTSFAWVKHLPKFIERLISPRLTAKLRIFLKCQISPCEYSLHRHSERTAMYRKVSRPYSSFILTAALAKSVFFNSVNRPKMLVYSIFSKKQMLFQTLFLWADGFPAFGGFVERPIEIKKKLSWSDINCGAILDAGFASRSDFPPLPIFPRAPC